MLTARQKLYLVAIEEEIATLQLQLCMETDTYLGAKSNDQKKEAATTYFEKVIQQCAVDGIEFKTIDRNALDLRINHRLPSANKNAKAKSAASTSTFSFIKNAASSAGSAASKIGRLFKTSAVTPYMAVTATYLQNPILILIGFEKTGQNNLAISIATEELIRATKEVDIEWLSVWSDGDEDFDRLITEFKAVFNPFLASLDSNKNVISEEELKHQAEIKQTEADAKQKQKEEELAEKARQTAAKIEKENKIKEVNKEIAKATAEKEAHEHELREEQRKTDALAKIANDKAAAEAKAIENAEKAAKAAADKAAAKEAADAKAKAAADAKAKADADAKAKAAADAKTKADADAKAKAAADAKAKAAADAKAKADADAKAKAAADAKAKAEADAKAKAAADAKAKAAADAKAKAEADAKAKADAEKAKAAAASNAKKH